MTFQSCFSSDQSIELAMLFLTPLAAYAIINHQCVTDVAVMFFFRQSIEFALYLFLIACHQRAHDGFTLTSQSCFSLDKV